MMTESGCSVGRLQTFNGSCFFTSEIATRDQDGAVRAAPPHPLPLLTTPQYHCANLYHLHSLPYPCVLGTAASAATASATPSPAKASRSSGNAALHLPDGVPDSFLTGTNACVLNER